MGCRWAAIRRAARPRRCREGCPPTHSKIHLALGGGYHGRHCGSGIQPRSTGTSYKFVNAVLCSQPGFGWLDESSEWFWFKPTTRNALFNQIQKVISVAPRIHVSELRAGISRHHRREGFAPPQRVLLALCAQAEGCGIDVNFVLAKPPLDYHEVLSDTESIIADVLRGHGPVMQRAKLEELCLGKGLHRDTFYIHLTYSPVIARYAPGVYGLRGAQIPPGLAASMVESRRKTRVLADYGWLPDGRIFLCYRLSEGTLSNGIVSIPAGMKSHIQGDFQLLIADGQSAGRFVVKDTQAWGLGPFFRRRGGEPGDLLQIICDMRQRVASATLGESGDDEGDGHPSQIHVNAQPAPRRRSESVNTGCPCPGKARFPPSRSRSWKPRKRRRCTLNAVTSVA